jgi:hypothetical protein
MICFTKDFEATKKALDVWFVGDADVDIGELFEQTQSDSARSSASSSDSDVIMAIIRLTMASKTKAIENRRAAYAWASTVVNTHVQSASVKKVVCFGDGEELRVDIENVREKDLMHLLIPAFAKFGTVKRCGVEEVTRVLNIDKNLATTNKAKAEIVGNLSTMTAVTEKLLQYRGDGGKSSKRRRFVDRAQEMLLRSQAVASDGLQSANISDKDDDTSEEA